MKIRGGGKIPDYVQFRDDNFTLIAYFRADKPRKGLEKFDLLQYADIVEEFLPELDFGELKKIKTI
jgi:hypothetical protein